ncbi:MAG TPA: GNAT family N-acetyltransferase [Bryobacteraceae bacterium]|nr:GNAT family N-acetyltransferase [Bryobacteraceae bacterium]
MRFRIGEPADIEAITRLINTAFQVERFFLDQDRIASEEVRARMNKGRFVLSEDDSALAGCVYIEPQGERAYLGLLSVDPSRQRTGLGTQLMAAGEDDARAAGCRFMDLLIVNLRLELPDYYRRLGYMETGTLPFPEEAHPKQPCHFIKMSKPL